MISLGQILFKKEMLTIHTYIYIYIYIPLKSFFIISASRILLIIIMRKIFEILIKEIKIEFLDAFLFIFIHFVRNHYLIDQ